MLIDFHAHVFPDRLAAGAVAGLAARAHFTPYTNGSLADTQRIMSEQGVDRFVALNIAVSPKTERHVNDFAISLLRYPNVIPFGSVHPDSENALSELSRLQKAGVKGIKFHNEYQGFFVDDGKGMRIYEECVRLGLIMLFHGAGGCLVSSSSPLPQANAESANAHRTSMRTSHLNFFIFSSFIYA